MLLFVSGILSEGGGGGGGAGGVVEVSIYW